MRPLVSLLLLLAVLLAGCGEPVRIGIREAQAARMPANWAPRPQQAAPPRVLPVAAHAEVAAHPAAPAGRQVEHAAAKTDGGAVRIPPIEQPHQPGDLVGLKLEHEGPAPARAITIGQIFVPGALPHDSGLVARIGGHEVPAQLDVKTTNPDGSVRFGVVTFSAAAPADVMLARHPLASTAAVDLATMPGGYDVTVDLVLHGANGDSPYHFAVGKLLADALHSGKLSYWLRGPLVTEARVDVPVVSSLHLTLDIREYADHSTFTDVQFNNDIAMQPVGGTLNYDVTISQHGSAVFRQSAMKHQQYQTWHYQAWSNGAPSVNVVHDVAEMERAGAVLSYDLSQGVSEQRLAREQAFLEKPEFTAILGSSAITRGMPGTGGREDLGPLPTWDATWLVSQNAVAARYALAQADAAGSVPWHLFDRTTGTYLTVDAYPRLWIDYRGGGNAATTALTQPQDDRDWSLDPSHQPGLSYLAYMQTGLRYYLDQLDAQATWAVLAVWPVSREAGNAIVATKGIQVRGAAWGLRELVEAAYINPDHGPLAHYFKSVLGNNIEYLLKEKNSAHQGEVHGWFQGVYGRRLAPWQQDFMASTLALAAEQGVAGAKELLAWETNFLAGRFLSEDKGMSPYDGVAYNMVLWEEDPDHPMQTWHDVQAGIEAIHNSSGGTKYAGAIIAYYLAARGVLGAIITVTGSDEAERAYAWLTAHPPSGTEGIDHYGWGPTWIIVPLKRKQT